MGPYQSCLCCEFIHPSSVELIKNSLIAGLHYQNKSGFFGGPLLSSQSEQSEKFSKNLDWLEKSQPSKKATFVFIM